MYVSTRAIKGLFINILIFTLVGLEALQQHTFELINGNNRESFSTCYIRRKRRKEKLKKDAITFMRRIMDECTHIKNFSVPVDPELIIVVAAEYVLLIP